MPKVTTTGNAIIIAYDENPIIATDPWIGDEEPAYFGSWVASHKIPTDLKEDIKRSKYIWFSHGHPDHLNSESLKRYNSNKILLPDHVGSRIFNDINDMGYEVSILPDRKWVELSKNIKVQSITTLIQDSVLLLDVSGKLFINLNDAGVRDCARYIRSVSKAYEDSYVLSLSGYGDSDMINFWDESGSFISPKAATRPSVGKQLSNFAKVTGAKTVIPFSSFHQYQRSDSLWAQEFTTPEDAYEEGIVQQINFIPPFSTINCESGLFDSYNPEKLKITVKLPEVFEDNWNDELEETDRKLINDYFSRKDRIQNYFGFLNFNVGGKDNFFKLRGKAKRGITFSVPRNSLITSIKYRIFDDLLIGNFMKTTLHGVSSLYEGGNSKGNFTCSVAKFADNGLAETEEEVTQYLAEYRLRAGLEFIIGALEDKSRDFLVRFAGKDTKIFDAFKSLYFKFR